MGLPRSTFYDLPAAPVGDVEFVAKIVVICDECETYGYRRVRAELRHQGFVVNGKKIRRLMRQNGLQPKRRRWYVITTTVITRVRFSPISLATRRSIVPISSGSRT
jgi:putative transposase